jgi:hypothetical protein
MSKDVKVSTKAELIKVWIDDKFVPLRDGLGTLTVKAGSHHAISWRVRGAPGTRYTIEITAPEEANLKRGDTFDEDGFDAGVAWFKINGDNPV